MTAPEYVEAGEIRRYDEDGYMEDGRYWSGVYECSACSSIVGKPERHTIWHLELGKNIHLASLGFGGLGSGSV